MARNSRENRECPMDRRSGNGMSLAGELGRGRAPFRHRLTLGPRRGEHPGVVRSLLDQGPIAATRHFSHNKSRNMGDDAVVAIVDDDPSVGRSVGRFVRSAGMEARSDRPANTCQKAAGGGTTDCVLVSVRMPERLWQFGSQRHTLFIAPQDSAAVRAQAVCGGALGCRRKPLGEVALLAASARAWGQETAKERAEDRSAEAGNPRRISCRRSFLLTLPRGVRARCRSQRSGES